jgi:acid phosphatase type 7
VKGRILTSGTVGDIAYADAWLKDEKGGYVKPLNLTDNGAEYDRILNDFYNEIAPISSARPYMVAVGTSSSPPLPTPSR